MTLLDATDIVDGLRPAEDHERISALNHLHETGATALLHGRYRRAHAELNLGAQER